MRWRDLIRPKDIMTSHPLDPLNAIEIETAAGIVRLQSGIDESAWFETITLDEPTRAETIALAEGQTLPRRAYVCCYERSSNRTLRGIVNLTNGRLLSWDHVPGAQARIPPDEFDNGDIIAKSDPAFRDRS